MARQAPGSTALATQDFAAASRSQAVRPHLLLLLGLFAASGCAALIYEIVWFQLLQLAIGSSAVSLGVLLGTYMGGMCLGSLALPKWISSARNPLRVYAALEAGIGALAILVLFGAPYLDQIYAAIASHGFEGIALRAALAAICLLPPTVLMGASLPALARGVESSPEGVSRLGLLYGGNIYGAVFGCLLAGFYLLRVYDMRVATWAGGAVNFAVAAISFLLAGNQPGESGRLSSREARRRPSASLAYIVIGLSGMTALGAEVVWTRLLTVMIGATVYTFSVILAVFLIGLGIGSAIGSAVG